MSATSDIVLPKNFDVNQLSFAPPKSRAENGSKSVFIAYNGKPLLVQTPEMSAPFGISVWPGERGAPDKYNIDVTFKDRENRPPLDAFYKMLEAISVRVITEAIDNSQQWFKRSKFPSREVVEELFTPMIRMHKDKVTGEVTNQYPPVFKMSLPYREGAFQLQAYNDRREQIDLMNVVQDNRGKNARVMAIVQCSAVWIVGTKFGVTWKVRQLRIVESAKLPSFAFQNDGETDPTRIASRPPAASSSEGERVAANRVGGGGNAPLLINSSDDDEGYEGHGDDDAADAPVDDPLDV